MTSGLLRIVGGPLLFIIIVEVSIMNESHANRVISGEITLRVRRYLVMLMEAREIYDWFWEKGHIRAYFQNRVIGTAG